MAVQYASKVLDQVQRGVIVSPGTHARLRPAGPVLEDDAGRAFRLLDGVPLLIDDPELVDVYAKASEKMNREYSAAAVARPPSWLDRLRSRDYRTPESVAALAGIFDGLPPGAVCISIGGGPTRADPRLLNVNIGPFPNVDVVGDAHALPYADASVDAIHCEAVFEHLHSPAVAAAEVHRVLKPGGRAYVCTPFLQAYHGYPHHYQNFTQTGHVNLFERAGLAVTESGVCVGPVFTLRNMVAAFLSNYSPRLVRLPLQAGWALLSLALAPLDIALRGSGKAHVMASTTYLVARKPA